MMQLKCDGYWAVKIETEFPQLSSTEKIKVSFPQWVDFGLSLGK